MINFLSMLATQYPHGVTVCEMIVSFIGGYGVCHYCAAVFRVEYEEAKKELEWRRKDAHDKALRGSWEEKIDYLFKEGARYIVVPLFKNDTDTRIFLNENKELRFSFINTGGGNLEVPLNSAIRSSVVTIAQIEKAINIAFRINM